MKPELKKIIAKVDDLPTLPTVYFNLSRLMDDPKSSADDVGRVIAKDQVLAARLLKLVNSAFYGFPGEVKTVSRGVVILGFAALKKLVLATSIVDLFAADETSNGFDLKRFWQHSVGCGVGARVIGSYISYVDLEELFVLGLLHDIGKLVHNQFLQQKFAEVMRAVNDRGVPIAEAEEAILQFNHAHTGKLLAERWNLPANFVEAIACHHRPERGKRSTIQTAVVHVADILSRAQEMGSGGDDMVPVVNQAAWDSLDLELSAIEPIMDDMEEQYEDAASFLEAQFGAGTTKSP